LSIQEFYDRFPERCLLVHIYQAVAQMRQFAELLQDKLALDLHFDVAAFDEIYHGSELAKPPHSTEALEILTRLFPAQAELFSRLNAAADLPDVAVPSSPESPPNLASLARFVESVPEPLTLPLRHSLLQMFLTVVASRETKRMLNNYYQNCKRAQISMDYYWLQSQKLERSKVA
jgi:hypothetical protein